MKDLPMIHIAHPEPWCFIVDFNSIFISRLSYVHLKQKASNSKGKTQSVKQINFWECAQQCQ